MPSTHDTPDLYRFFAADLSGPDVTLPRSESHHALHVLRLRAGAEVELFDGRGNSAAGRIAAAARGEVRVAVERRNAFCPRPRPEVHLAFAVPKGKRLDWLLEKAAELGAASLQPVSFERSVAGGDELSASKRDRWLAHCIAAAKQCGLDLLPDLRKPATFAEFLSGQPGAATILGDVGPDAMTLTEALKRADPNGPGGIRVLVGPEGGVTGGEFAEALAAGFLPVRIGRTTLRVETAAVAMLAAVTAMCVR